MPKKFSVLDMAQNAQFDSDKEELDELFNNKEEVKEEFIEEAKLESKDNVKKPWSPKKNLTDDMPELQNNKPVYDKSEMIVESHELRNGSDDEAIELINNTKNNLERAQYNIEYAKKRWGWKQTQIPNGEYEARIMMAASDPDINSAQSGIDEVFKEIEEIHPEFIISRINDSNNKIVPLQQDINEDEKENDITPSQKKLINHNTHEPSPRDDIDNNPTQEIGPIAEPEKVTVIIDKSQSNEISWSEEEVKKLQKARTVELNIREEDNLNFSEIEDVDSNVVDKVLSQYIRASNDIDAPLPASRYRATFRGLSYPEVLDLNNSNRINSIDSEKLKWSIVFDHMSNMSIGNWNEYDYYINDKGEEVIIYNNNVPKGISRSSIKTHTKFDDFLKKTSFIDIEYMIWKVLCATSMENELLSVTCNAVKDGVRCGNSYDWIYSPNELLLIEEVDPQVLKEMKVTTEASSEEDIIKNFMGSPVMSNSTVELPHSKFKLIFGHISGYDYLTKIYNEMQKYNEDNLDENDPTNATKIMTFTMLSVIKGILIAKQSGGYYRIKDINGIMDALHKLDEVDWQVAYKVFSMMTEPYQFKYELRDMICPKCKHKSTVSINNMTDLLFLAIQSLASVEVELTRI